MLERAVPADHPKSDGKTPICHCERSEAIQPSGSALPTGLPRRDYVTPRNDHKGGFASLHPAVSISYFVLVIGVSVFVPHPVLLACSVLGALALCLLLRGGQGILRLLAGLLPLALIAAAINPLFNHQGVTIIGYLGGNPVTREALLYGAALACLLVAMLLWFTCYNQVITTEKFLAVFGRVIPSLALTISMALRFFGRYLRQLKAITAAQRGLADRRGTGTVLSGAADKTVPVPLLSAARLRSSFAVLSILTSWALESALDTADSMHARGYGLPGRSVYRPFRFTARDAIALALILACATIVIVALTSGVVSAQYLPSLLLNQGAAGLPAAARNLLIGGAYGAFGLLCLLPALLELQEEVAWRISRSTI